MQSDLPFGLWIKKRRKSLDLTRNALAERVGCSSATIEKIESEERRPSLQIAELLADALKVPLEQREIFLRAARGVGIFQELPPDHFARPSFSKTNLPAPLTRMVGRKEEINGIDYLFKNEDCRLVNLLGPGGVGKTRLGIEYARQKRDVFPGGVYYVPLASVSAPELVIPAIAEALGFHFSGPADLKKQLFGDLGRFINESTLLVLDNLEHLTSQSSSLADLIAEILQEFPAIKILCTSREKANIQGEWAFDLRGLPVSPLDVSKSEESDAADLFAECARRNNPRFVLTEATKPAVYQICKLLEGIPLALELAAVWVGALSCEEIAQEIEANIDFLTVSARNVPERHRSLKASFDHSWRLLSDAERNALSRLSVFRGGFDRAAAERIGRAAPSLLLTLVSKSLVRHAGDNRYDLHETIRQYAALQLAKKPELDAEVRRSHSDYYLRVAAEREWDMKSARQRRAMQETLKDMENIRAAWAWAIQNQFFSALGKAVRCLGWFFEISGLIQEGIDHFELLIRVLKDRKGEWRDAFGQALAQQGMLYFRKGYFKKAQSLLDESLAALRPLGDPALLADALIYAGIVAHINGEMKRAMDLVNEGLTRAQAAKSEWLIGYAIYHIGYIAVLHGNYQQGYQQMAAAIETWNKFGDSHSVALGLNYLGPVLVKLERYHEARACLRKSLEFYEEFGNRWGMGTAYRYLGLVEITTGNPAQAQSYLHKSLEMLDGFVASWDIPQTLVYLGKTNLLLGQFLQSKACFMESLRHAEALHSALFRLEALLGLVCVEIQLGNFGTALKWLSLTQRKTSELGEI